MRVWEIDEVMHLLKPPSRPKKKQRRCDDYLLYPDPQWRAVSEEDLVDSVLEDLEMKMEGFHGWTICC